jgi:cholesterol transport system auxiliary component
LIIAFPITGGKKMTLLTRSIFFISLLALPSCTALSTLNQAATPLATFELQPITNASAASRSRITLLIVEPTAPAAIATDRILVKQNQQSVSYLPDARWADEAQLMIQSVIIQSLSAGGRFGFVGAQDVGPVPDMVLLTRIDRFGVDIGAGDTVTVRLSFDLTVLRDRDQRVLGTRSFSGDAAIRSDQVDPVVTGFQMVMDDLLGEIVSWTMATAR